MTAQATTMFSIEQLQLLRSARALVKQEFGFSLSVSAGNVLEQLYAFALSSTDETLLKLHRDIMLYRDITAIGERTMSEAATRPGKSRTTAYRGSNKASYYRGARV